jgi:hypothetical protein
VLEGWFELTPELLEGRRQALASDELTHYFDGQEPQWRHALAPAGQIPRRPVAVDGLAQLGAPAGDTQSLVMLIGADGTGKTTALRQIACDLVARGRRVLVRSPGARLDPAAVGALDPVDGGWVLVSDEADEIASDVEKAVEQLFETGRGRVHWLLAARDIEWKAQFLRRGRVLEPAWERFGNVWPILGHRSIVLSVTAEATEASAGLGAWTSIGAHAADAPAILDAWAGAGALGALARLPEGERPEALAERSTKKLGISNATLLGASLDLRFGVAGLPTLVEQALGRLDDAGVREAFLFSAVAQAAGVDGLDLLVLADLVGVDRARAHQTILAPLAEAGLAGGSAGTLRPRHPSLSGVAVQLLADRRVDGDLEDLLRRLVRGTAATGNDVKSLAAGGAIMNCGPLLSEKLQQLGLAPELSDQVAATVGDEAEAALPDFLLFTVARARTYQAAGRPADARRALRARMADATSKQDWDMVGRSYLHELSRPEAGAGRLAEAAALAGLALADGEGLGQVTMNDGKLALLAMGAAATELAVAESADVAHSALFRRQLRVCTHLGEKVTPKWDQRARFDFHTFAVQADEYGIPKTSAAEALLWLAETLQTALAMVEDPDVKDMAQRLIPEKGRLEFSHLEHTIGLGRLPWAKE